MLLAMQASEQQHQLSKQVIANKVSAVATEAATNARINLS